MCYLRTARTRPDGGVIPRSFQLCRDDLRHRWALWARRARRPCRSVIRMATRTRPLLAVRRDPPRRSRCWGSGNDARCPRAETAMSSRTTHTSTRTMRVAPPSKCQERRSLGVRAPPANGMKRQLFQRAVSVSELSPINAQEVQNERGRRKVVKKLQGRTRRWLNRRGGLFKRRMTGSRLRTWTNVRRILPLQCAGLARTSRPEQGSLTMPALARRRSSFRTHATTSRTSSAAATPPAEGPRIRCTTEAFVVAF